MDKLREAARQALEALQKAEMVYAVRDVHPMAVKQVEEAITALREALDHIPDVTKMVQPVNQDFETWWEREGQEFLYDLNTTTDDDIKLVAEFAWKNGAYKAEQPVSQETVAWGQPDACGNIVDSITPYDKETPDMQKWAAQYSVPLYTLPVRTKDLTDDDLLGIWFGTDGLIEGLRAVIAADREKNK